MDVTPVEVPHGFVTVFAYRNRSNLAYVTDAKSVPHDAVAVLRGAKVLVVNALFRTDHPSHLSLPEALQVAREIGAERTYLTHLTHDLTFTLISKAELHTQRTAGVRWAHHPDMITIDFTNMMATAVANGVTEQEWGDAATDFRRAHDNVQRLRTSKTIGFLDLPNDAALLKQSTDFATRVRGRYDDVVILGIGGSALGPIALRTALCTSGWNTLSSEERAGFPRLHVLDNVDPVNYRHALRPIGSTSRARSLS